MIPPYMLILLLTATVPVCFLYFSLCHRVRGQKVKAVGIGLPFCTPTLRFCTSTYVACIQSERPYIAADSAAILLTVFRIWADLSLCLSTLFCIHWRAHPPLEVRPSGRAVMALAPAALRIQQCIVPTLRKGNRKMALRLRSGPRWLPLVISAMLAALVTLPMAVREAQAQTSVPGAPSSLETVSRDGGAYISWRIPERAEEDGVTGYSLRHRPLGGGNWTSMNVPVPDGEAVVAEAT